MSLALDPGALVEADASVPVRVAYSHILSAVSETPWAVLPSKLQAMVELLAIRARGEHLSPEAIQERIGAPRAASGSASNSVGNVAVLHLFGVISQRMGLMTQTSGGTGTEAFAQAFQQAVADPGVASILIEVDSPGGSVFGVQELADQIYGARGSKPIVAQVNSLCASAAYWIASQCDEVVSTPGGMTGSIGVYTVHEDLSAASDAAGVKVTYISAGKYKTESQPFQPLGAEAQAAMQEQVDASYGLFTATVARGRGAQPTDVQNGYGQGRLLGAKQAKAAGLVDRIGTLDDTLGRLTHAPARARIGQRADAIGDDFNQGDAAIAIATSGLTAKAVPANDSPKIAPADEPWDAGEVEKSLPDDNQKAWLKVFAWYDETAADPDDDGLPDAKGAWKLPHAKADGTLVPRGLHAAAARLDQAQIPEKDMAGVKAHLAHHYAELHETPPWEQAAASTDTAMPVEAETSAQAPAAIGRDNTPKGGSDVDEKEFRETLAKYEAQIAAKDTQLATLQEASTQQAAHIAALQATERRKRFTDMVMGRNGEKDGLRWYGEVAKNVGLLEKLSAVFGEESDDFQAYVDMQEQTAKQLQAVTRVLGTDQGNEAGAGNSAAARIEAEAAKLEAATPGMTHAQAVAKAAELNPALYAEHLAEVRG